MKAFIVAWINFDEKVLMHEKVKAEDILGAGLKFLSAIDALVGIPKVNTLKDLQDFCRACNSRISIRKVRG